MFFAAQIQFQSIKYMTHILKAKQMTGDDSLERKEKSPPLECGKYEAKTPQPFVTVIIHKLSKRNLKTNIINVNETVN